MNKKLFVTLALCTGFMIGFAFRGFLKPGEDRKPRATGIGGIFFKCKDPKSLRAWYRKYLGLETNQYGAVFEWRQGIDTTSKGFTQWSPFTDKTKYFEPSSKEFMINYRVEGLDALLQSFRRDSVMITDSVQTAEYGKFVHVMDPEANKIELWEPNDDEFEKLGKQIGAKTTK